jgi:hypothetical protein
MAPRGRLHGRSPAPRSRERGPMNPNTPWTTRLVGAGVAAAIGCAVTLSACGGTGQPAAKATITSSTTSSPAAVTTLPSAPTSSPPTTAAPVSIPNTTATTTTATIADFLSPTGNISCEIDYQRSGLAEGAYCQTISPPQSATLSPDGSYASCTGSNCIGNPGIGTPTLAYGNSTQIGPFSCMSAPDGVTCTAAGRGFTISRSGIAAAGASAPGTGPAPTNPATAMSALAGPWGAHEESLVITNTGSGHLDYADLTACPSCSMASAPLGTIDFVLTAVTNGVATGHVTTSSDAAVATVGEPVKASLTPADPGEFLQLAIGGRLSNFCNSTSAGQCGA